MKRNITDEEIIRYCINHPEATRRSVAGELHCGHDRAMNLLRVVQLSGTKDVEIIKENVRLAKSNQKQLDLNRIRNKSFREQARLENSLVAMSEEIRSLLGKYDFSKFTKKHDIRGDKSAGIIHLSDLHLNELVSIDGNKYDFDIASQRLKQFATKCKEYLKLHNIKNVLVANTGDILNSDRRLDEYLSQASNRTNATMLAVYLLEQFLIDLNQDFNLKVAQVSGNESRVKDEPGWSDIVLSDNYDWLIFNILRHSLRTAKGIEFILGNPQELCVSVANQNILLLHGQQLRSNIEESIQQIRGKYAELGKTIDFVIFGDIHSVRIGETYARGSSMVGANAYSFSGLQLASRASQNVYVVYSNGNRDAIKVDLQSIEAGTQGYDIISELKAYNAKSAGKLHQDITTFRVVI